MMSKCSLPLKILNFSNNILNFQSQLHVFLFEKKNRIHCSKPKKKTGRKLFTQNYDDIEEETIFDVEPKSVKKKPVEELIIEIPRFTHKLFDGKKFGSPSQNKTPISKVDLRKDDLKTPATSKILAERKTPFGSARSKLDSPPRTFETYGFLKSLDGLYTKLVIKIFI